MSCKLYKVFIFIVTFLNSSCSEFLKRDITKHPDYVQQHNTQLIVGNEIVSIDYLWKSTYKRDTIYPYAVDGMSFSELKKLSGLLLPKPYDSVVNIGLYAPSNVDNYKEWKMNFSEVQNIGVMYIDNNQVHFDFFSDLDSIPKSYFNLSDPNCEVHNAFLLNESSVKDNPSLIKLKLSTREILRLEKPDLAERADDSLYKLVKSYGF